MNRTEFMRQLEILLQSIPQAEREEALQYYNDYFDDAGVENEREVLDALGNPAKVAENIKRDLYGDDAVQASTIKNPPMKYQDGSEQEQTDDYADATGAQNTNKGTFFQRMGAKFDGLPTWGKVLIVIGGIILAPAIIGLISTILGALFSLVTGWFSLIFGFAVAALALLAVLIILIIAGFMCMMQAPMGGVALIGVGLVCGGIGILFLMLTVAMIGIATPAIFRGIGKLWSSIFGKKEVAA